MNERSEFIVPGERGPASHKVMGSGGGAPEEDR